MASKQQPAEEINPYAAPAEAGGYDSQSPAGIGVWRDGYYVVMHRAAPFPPVCIFSGQPAERYRRYALLWYYPIDWTTRRLILHVPLCEEAFQQYRLRWRLGTAAILLPVLLTGALLYLAGHRADGWLCSMMLVCLIGILFWGGLRWWDGQPLRFVRVRGQYLWLSGADPKFVVQLPPWVSGS